jgi:predicted HTH domain antitoxin
MTKPYSNDFRQLVILLFQQQRISIGRASQLVKMHLLQFQRELAIRKTPIHYDIADFEKVCTI